MFLTVRQEVTTPPAGRLSLNTSIDTLIAATKGPYAAWIDEGKEWHVSANGKRLEQTGPAMVINDESLSVVQNALKKAGLKADEVSVKIGGGEASAEKLHSWAQATISIPKRLGYKPAFMKALSDTIKARDMKPQATELEAVMNQATEGNNFGGWTERKQGQNTFLELTGPTETIKRYEGFFISVAIRDLRTSPGENIRTSNEQPHATLSINTELASRGSFINFVSANNHELASIRENPEVYTSAAAQRPASRSLKPDAYIAA